MSEIVPPRRIGRSIAALFAGLLAVVVLSTGTDAIMHSSGIFPPMGQTMPDWLFVPAMGYRILYGVIGPYLTATLAPDRPMSHALVLGAVGLALATAGAVATWNAGPAFGPRWYPLSLIVTAVPAAWLGGKLYTRR